MSERLAGILLAGILLAGCASPLPTIPEKQLVPVPVSCLDAPIAPPAFISDPELVKMDSYHAMLALWLDRRLRGIYEKRLEAALAGCWIPASDGL